MRFRLTMSGWHMIPTVLLLVITSLVPLPAVAGDGGTAKKPSQTIAASAAQIVARDVAATPGRTIRAREARQGSASTGSTSFFKTRPGIIALSVMAAGTGYALYSAQHDRIHSAGKK